MSVHMATAGDPTRVAGRRIIGYFFDGLIDELVLLTMIALSGVKVSQNAAVGTIRPGEGGLTSKLVTVLIVYLLYYVGTKVVMLGFFGATPGMLIVAVRCVRWDGRPCGLWRAFVRTVVMGVGQFLLGSVFLLASTVMMWYSKGHKAPGDFVAGTYVIDSMYSGRLIIETLDGLYAGPPSVTREEAEVYLREQAKAEGHTGAFLPPLHAGAKNGEPFLDKDLDTYVVWNAKDSSWLAFDKSSGAWNRVG